MDCKTEDVCKESCLLHVLQNSHKPKALENLWMKGNSIIWLVGSSSPLDFTSPLEPWRCSIEFKSVLSGQPVAIEVCMCSVGDVFCFALKSRSDFGNLEC